MIKIGIDGTKKIYIGNNSVTTVYIGTKRVFPQTNLPYDAEIEYLECTGTQWIDTLEYGDLNTESELCISFNVVDNTYGCCVFGTRKSATEKNYSSILGRTDTKINIDMYNYQVSRCTQSVTRNVIYTIHTDKNVRSLSANGKILNSNTSVINTPFTTERTLKIGYTDPLYDWYDLTENLKGKIYSCYIKKNGVLVRDLIPVRIGQVGYMYDKVSGQLFGNSGTGNFVLGADKSYGKYKFTLSDSSVITAECDNSSAITSADTSAYQSSLVQAEIGNCITSIGDNAFSNYTNLTSITISNTVTNIGYNAFGRCTGLTSVIIPESVTTISSNAFSNCKNLTSINIPSGVTSIGDFAFYGCSNFTSITVEATNPPLLGGNYAFGVTNNCPIYVPSGSVEAYKSAEGWNTYTDRIQAIL